MTPPTLSERRFNANYSVYGAPQPLQAAPFLPCHTRLVPQRLQMSNLFIEAPQFWQEYLRLPPLAVFSMCSPQSGHAFWSCLMGCGHSECNGDFSPTCFSPCIIQRVTTHRLVAVLLILLGISVFVFAKRISTLKSTAWARFYQHHPKAAERNPLSVHAGTERSIRLVALMWRLVGVGILLNGFIRLQ